MRYDTLYRRGRRKGKSQILTVVPTPTPLRSACDSFIQPLTGTLLYPVPGVTVGRGGHRTESQNRVTHVAN